MKLLETRRIPFAPQHYDARADTDTGVEVYDVPIGQPYAARGHERADGRWLIGAVNAIHGLAEIKCARAERIARTTRHEPRQIGLAGDHLFRGAPVGPRRHSRYFFDACPGETFAPDADAVAQRLAIAEHQIEIGVRGIDEDRAAWLFSPIIDQRAPEPRRQFFRRTGLRPHVGRQRRHV